MPKILFIDQFAEIGGGQRILLDLVEHFTRVGNHCAVCLPAPGPVETALRKQGLSTFDFHLPSLTAGTKGAADHLRFLMSLTRTKKELSQIAQAWPPDLIFCNSPRAMWSAVSAAKSLDVPLVAAMHLIFGGKELMLLSRCLRDKAVKAVAFCSECAASPFRNALGSKVNVIDNWPSPGLLEAPRAENAKSAVGIQERDFAVGVLGRVSKNKGQRLLVQALLPALKAHPDWRLLIAGATDFEDPEEMNALRSLAGNLPSIRFLGAVEKPSAFLDALDVCVVPSTWEEPFGLVAVEAMARRIPVVSTRSGALPEIVQHGVTGLIVEKNEEALRSAIEQLYCEPYLRKQMGVAGRKRVESQFSPRRGMDAYLELCIAAISCDR